MSTTAVTAGQVMDRAANLLNDPNKTDYNYTVMLPYLNMAIEELTESMEESNNSPSNLTSNSITVPVGVSMLQPVEVSGPGVLNYPDDLTEVQDVMERLAGTNDTFVRMERKEFLEPFPANNSLLYWMWQEQKIKFNPNGALTTREVRLRYITQGVPYVTSPDSIITMIHSRQFLSFKTAAYCAMFIGENESRAQILEDQAQKALERTTTISNKGRQQIVTRHRPFRSSYKLRGWV